MSNEHVMKTNKHCTGALPKTKQRNNTVALQQSERNSPGPGPGSWTNNLVNLASDFQHPLNLSNHLGSFGATTSLNRRTHSNYTPLENSHYSLRMNGSLTPSASTSRRNSGTIPKCENVAKCPDKRQIEDKLSQIQQYLEITSSLMSNMSNSEIEADAAERECLDQMYEDLKDSENKLVMILKDFDEFGNNVKLGTDRFGGDSVKNEHQTTNGDNNTEAAALNSQHTRALDLDEINESEHLLSLQQIAENKLKAARSIQHNLSTMQYDNERTTNKNTLPSMQDVDAAIRELEERSKRSVKDLLPRESQLQDQLMAEVDYLQNQIISLQNVNEDRNQIIQVLDNRDAELRAQHHELQGKLNELHARKSQVDQLCSQLHSLEEADGQPDVGSQVKRIVTMKDQLSKLKDMLEIVKSTQVVMENCDDNHVEEQDLACQICTKEENFLEKTFDKNPVVRAARASCSTSPCVSANNERKLDKQVNKNSIERQRAGAIGGARPKTTSNAVKSTILQAELEAKKRELEEIMGKHKAGTSNLNHDVGCDNKSEFSCSSNAFFENGGPHPCWPSTTENNRFNMDDRCYSSDECLDEINENDFGSLNQSFAMPVTMVQSASKQDRPIQERNRKSMLRTPERLPVTSTTSIRSNNNSNAEQSKNQLQKQLELIRGVCDSMLEQQKSQHSNLQLRNNLTPSPLHSELRFASSSPSPHPMNTLANPFEHQQQWMLNNDWSISTNALQTQSFMLNTINQCCQMLWLQQRELLSLRQTMMQLQERIDPAPLFSGDNLATQQTGSTTQNNHKGGHVTSACSMPNLNQYPGPSGAIAANLDPYHHQHHNNRLLNPCLNNGANLNLNHPNHPLRHQVINNGVLHGANINTMPPPPPSGQIWNGQALNNQVAPGNRANNYWDNFRSYSRQNLLSTTSNKSNDGFQQSIPPNNFTSSTSTSSPSRCERSLPPLTSSLTIKSNSGSQENTPYKGRTSSQFASRRNSDSARNIALLVPPDVLNLNHNLNRAAAGSVATNKRNEQNPPPLDFVTRNLNEDPGVCYHYLNNSFLAGNETSSDYHHMLTEDHLLKDCVPEASSRNKGPEESHLKTKLFEELRENVYKEAVNLIAANEARPHFLIQLFRDLQMISSDPLRLKILQSIQTVIAHSLVSSHRHNINSLNAEPSQENQQILPPGDSSFSLHSTVWSRNHKSTPMMRNTTLHVEPDIMEIQTAIGAMVPFLNDREVDTIDHQFLRTLKQVLIDSESFHECVSDTVFKKHFSNVLDDVLSQYEGKKVHHVKVHIIQTVKDLLRGELSFIQLIQETCPENCDLPETLVNADLPSSNLENNSVFNQPDHVEIESTALTVVQNGDLAEADQGLVEENDDDEEEEQDEEEEEAEEEEEEEGAVGGFWDLQMEPSLSNADNVIHNISNAQYQSNAAISPTSKFNFKGPTYS